MKQVITYLLSFVLLANSLQAVVIFTTFKLNQDYIAEVLCINKNNKTVPDCKGSCHLTKELSKAADQNQDDTQVTVKMNELTQIHHETQSTIFQVFIKAQNEYTMRNWQLPKYNYSSTLERPPTFG